jgi:hypothetical protein
MSRPRKPAFPFRYFNSSPEVIWLVVLMYVRFPCRCATSRICCSNAVSTFAMRRCGYGGTGSARCLPVTSAARRVEASA